MVPPRYQGEDLPICCGGLIILPQVIEAARAGSWRKEGALRDFYGDQQLTPLARDSIDIVAYETVMASNDAIRARNES
jgi:hypothetical protein